MKKGVTLLELMIVMAIIAVLLALVIFSLRPDTILTDTEKRERQGHVVAIDKAIRSYMVDNENDPLFDKYELDPGVYIICKYGATCPSDYLDLDALVDMEYLAEIPVDDNFDTTEGSGFNIEINDNHDYLVVAQADLPIVIPPIVFTHGGVAGDSISDLQISEVGNIFYSGHCSGEWGQQNVDFDPTAGTDIKPCHYGGSNPFLTKINADHTYGYNYNYYSIPTGSSEATNIAVDSTGNIYMVGYIYSGTVDLDPTSGVDNKTVSDGNPDLYLQKMNANGTYGYTNMFLGGINGINNRAMFVEADSNDNIYILGYFYGTVDFNPTAGVDNKTASNADIFLTKFNEDGTYAYTLVIGDTGYQIADTFAIDTSDNIYILGQFSGNTDFDPTVGTDIRTTTLGSGTSVTKINADGTYGYTYTTFPTVELYSDNFPRNIAVDNIGNIYYTGELQAPTDVDPTGGNNLQDCDCTYLTKMNVNQTYGYTIIYDESLSSGDLLIDDSNNIYLTGSFNSVMDFDHTGGTDNKTSNGGYDAFYTRINADGSYAFTYTFGGAGTDYPTALTKKNTGEIYLGGIFQGTVNFDLTGGTNQKTSNGSSDVFVMNMPME